MGLEEYAEKIDGVLEFLGGNYGPVLRDLEGKMNAASMEMEFEKAIEYRELLNSVKQIAQKQKITHTDGEDKDIIALAADDVDAVVQVFFVRSGKIIGRDHFHVRVGTEENRFKFYMTIGKDGNTVFFDSVKKAKEEGLRVMLYTHPCGFHGHGAGPDFGLFSNQGFLPVMGEQVIHNNTSFALELNTCEYLEMYEMDTYLFTEETVILIDDEVHFIADGRENIYILD